MSDAPQLIEATSVAMSKAYDDPAAMTKTGNNSSGHRYYHKACNAKKERERKLKC